MPGILEASVIRRSVMLMVFVAPALLLNFALSVLAASWLDAVQFGHFYVALGLASVLTAPSAILTFFFARYFIELRDAGRGDEIPDAYRRFVGLTVRWTALGGIVAWLVLAGLGELTGTDSLLLITCAVGLAYIHFVADTARALLQGLERFVRLGLYTLTWMLLRFVLALAAIMWIGSVWGGLAGVGAGGMLVLVFFLLFNGSGASRGPGPAGRQATAPLPNLGSLLGFSVGYSFFLRFPFSTWSSLTSCLIRSRLVSMPPHQ